MVSGVKVGKTAKSHSSPWTLHYDNVGRGWVGKKRSLVVSGAGDVDDGCERIHAAAAARITPNLDQLRNWHKSKLETSLQLDLGFPTPARSGRLKSTDITLRHSNLSAYIDSAWIRACLAIPSSVGTSAQLCMHGCMLVLMDDECCGK